MTPLAAQARRAGAVYLLMSAAGAPALLLIPGFIVADDAAETMRRIAERAATYRLLLLGELAGGALFIVLGWSLYHLFENADRRQARLMLVFVAISATLSILDVGLLSPPLVILARAPALTAFTPAQLDALALGLLGVRGYALAANEALWGLWLVPLGLLIIKSRYLPRVIGVLALVASVGYVLMSVSFIAFPAFRPMADRVGMWLIQGELSVILWLLIMGAKDPRDRAVAAQLAPAP